MYLHISKQWKNDCYKIRKCLLKENVCNIYNMEVLQSKLEKGRENWNGITGCID